MSRKAPETTVVTTLTVTHILKGCTAAEATGVAEIIADTAKQALERGYTDGHVRRQGQADNIAVSCVQIFENDRGRGDVGARRAEQPDAGAPEAEPEAEG